MNLNPCTYFVKEAKPDKITGYLNRRYAFNYYYPLEIGTPVYEDKKGYYMIHELINTGDKHRIYFYKEGSFKEHFNLTIQNSLCQQNLAFILSKGKQ